MVKELDEEVALALSADMEYLKINEDLQKMIQEEMMRNVKWKINANPDAINKMSRLKDLIVAAKQLWQKLWKLTKNLRVTRKRMLA
jgi:hypothetical protein